MAIKTKNLCAICSIKNVQFFTLDDNVLGKNVIALVANICGLEISALSAPNNVLFCQTCVLGAIQAETLVEKVRKLFTPKGDNKKVAQFNCTQCAFTTNTARKLKLHMTGQHSVPTAKSPKESLVEQPSNLLTTYFVPKARVSSDESAQDVPQITAATPKKNNSNTPKASPMKATVNIASNKIDNHDNTTPYKGLSQLYPDHEEQAESDEEAKAEEAETDEAKAEPAKPKETKAEQDKPKEAKVELAKPKVAKAEKAKPVKAKAKKTEVDNELLSNEKGSNTPLNHQFSCSMCPFKTVVPKRYKIHLETDHNIDNPRIYHCNQCRKTYQRGFALVRHIALKHSAVQKVTKKLFAVDDENTANGNDTDEESDADQDPVERNIQIKLPKKRTAAKTKAATSPKKLKLSVPLGKAKTVPKQTTNNKDDDEGIEPNGLSADSDEEKEVTKTTHGYRKTSDDESNTENAPKEVANTSVRSHNTTVARPKPANALIYPCAVCDFVTDSPENIKKHRANEHEKFTKEIEEETTDMTAETLSNSVAPSKSFAFQKTSDDKPPPELAAAAAAVDDKKRKSAKKPNANESGFMKFRDTLNSTTADDNDAPAPEKQRNPLRECTYCPFVTHSSKKYTKHMAVSHSVANFQPLMNSTVAPAQKRKLAEVDDADDGVKKSEKSKTKRLACNQCDKTFKTVEKLRSHVDSVHMGGAVFTCPYCQKTYKSRDKYEEHIFKEACRNKKHVCQANNCSKRFAHKKELSNHVATKHGHESVEVYEFDGDDDENSDVDND